ncbi:MAG TPA: hypothetical protein VGR27_10845 [Longimicrobiaceae bacterium]|nr:hypothetical protein [Longimicrobiaceae bacterium]
MYQRDYILRIIEQLGRALIQLRNRIMGRQMEAGEVHAELRAVAARAGVDLDLARVLGSEMLPRLIAPSGEAEPARCWLFAELLYLEGLQARQDGRTEAARADLVRAAEFYALLPSRWEAPEGFPPAAERVAEIRTLLDSTP